MGWIGVDFDGTLAHYDSWQGTKLGAPIPKMVNRVKGWLAAGNEVRIMTARVSSRNQVMRLENGEDMWESESHRKAIEGWCEKHLGRKLAVTAEKDFQMIELWDDRAVTVGKNTGEILSTPYMPYKDKYGEWHGRQVDAD